MKLEQDNSQASFIIKSYESGKIIINDKQFSDSVLITLDEIISPWLNKTFAELQAADIALGLKTLHQPQVVIIGCGEHNHFPNPRVLQPLIDKQIGHEIMTTTAACRTYNLLASDGRKVVAMLML